MKPLNSSPLGTLPLLVLLVALTAVSAQEPGQVISQAYEIILSEFQLPATTSSGITFRQCADCEAIRTRVTEATRYAVNGKPVMLEDFRKILMQTADRSATSVTVLRHLESNSVLSVDAWL